MKVPPQLLEGITIAAVVLPPLLQPELSFVLRVVGVSCGATYCLMERSNAKRQRLDLERQHQADSDRLEEITTKLKERTTELESLERLIITASSKAQAFRQSEELAEQRLEELKEIEFEVEGTLRDKRYQLESLGEQILELEQLAVVQENLEAQEQAQCDRIKYLASQIKEKHTQLSGLNELVGEELDALVLEKQTAVENLEKQILDLEELAQQQFAELEAAEAASKKDAENYRFNMIEEIEAYRLQTTEQLKAIASQDEETLKAQATLLEQQLEADKQAFLEKYSLEKQELLSQIEYLNNQLGGAYQLLEEYRLPSVPRGCEPEAAVARELMLFFRKKGVICTNQGSYIREDGRIVVLLEPLQGGEASFKKAWLKEFQMRERLLEPIEIRTVPGAVEFLLKVDTPQPSSSPSPPPSPPSPPPEPLYPVTNKELDDFQEPDFRMPPRGEISRLERTWAVWLWERQGITNQSIILGKIWRNRRGNPVSRGDGASFLLARDRLQSILENQGIEVKSRRSTV